MLLNLAWITLILTLSISTAYPQATGETAEQHYKNIQVLKGAPASQVEPASLDGGCQVARPSI